MPKSVAELGNQKALLSIIANGIQMIGMLIGVPLLVGIPIGIFLSVSNSHHRKYFWVLIIVGPLFVGVALATPLIMTLVASSKG